MTPCPIATRRTFAIISHPDAGKTTLTEKLLLYGGAVHLAGSVTARKNQRATTSDWMELEKQRGISVSSTVLQFEYRGRTINLLDTPGHKDFSEDTYRVLTAVDAAVMVIDAAKGIESQTRKLFEVCRRRGVPIFTFFNKLDRPGRPPLDLLDELESVLGIHAIPLNWPLGDGPDFRGIYDREQRQVHLFERTPGGAYRAPVTVTDFNDPTVTAALPPDIQHRARTELELLEGAGASFDLAAINAGRLSPVFFGSAANNFGVEHLLSRFLDLAPPPAPRFSLGRPVQPTTDPFSAFVFKIQANMNPKHRDHVAFIRIVSGTFRRDMTVLHSRTGKPIRLSNSQRLFARERETVDHAHAGDIEIVVGNFGFLIGDTLSEDPAIVFNEIPHFPPECFAILRAASTSQMKRFREGLDQLLREGLAQAFDLRDSVTRAPLLGAVGPLQFEVIQYRLQNEYGAESRLEPSSWTTVRWLPHDSPAPPVLPSGATRAFDAENRPVILFPNTWAVQYFTESNPNIPLFSSPP
ncbi:MAG: peptide chain release factor 3 [Verrucomicrobiia bacterium]